MFTVNQFKSLINESQDISTVVFSVEVISHIPPQIISCSEYLELSNAIKYSDDYVSANSDRQCNIYYKYTDENNELVKSQLMSVYYSNDDRLHGITYSYKNKSLCELILNKENTKENH